MGQVMKYRLAVYEPDGAFIDYLLMPESWDASLPVNDLGAMSLKYPRVAAGFEYLGQPCEVALQVLKGSTWVEAKNGRYLNLEASQDRAKHDMDVPSFTLVSYGSLMDGVRVIPARFGQGTNYDADGKRKFLSATVGQIVTAIVSEARGLVENLVPNLALGFSPTRDSLGASWDTRVTIYYEAGTSLLTIVQNLAAQGHIDFWFEERTLMIVNANTAGSHRDIMLDETHATEAPVRTSIAGLVHTAFLVGDEGNVWRADNEGTPTPWGTSMTFITQGGVKDEATAHSLISAELESGSRARSEYTWQTTSELVAWTALADVEAGDWVKLHTANGFIDVRVFQATVSFSKDGVKIALTLNDRFEDSQVRSAKRMKGIVNGASGDAGTSSVPSKSQAAKAKPATVQGVVAESEGYWEGDLARSLVRVGYAPVITDVHGLGIDIDHYDVAVASRSVKTPATSGVVVDGLAPAQEVSVSVTAVSRDGVRGESTYANLTTVYPDARLDPPTILEGSCETGIVTLSWDGKLQAVGGAPYVPPAHFKHVRVEESANQKSWVPVGVIAGGGLVLDRQAKVGEALYYRAIAVDRLGNESEPSQVVEVAVVNALKAQVDSVLAESQAARDEAERVGREAQASLLELDSRLSGVVGDVAQATQDARDAHNEAVRASEKMAETKAMLEEALSGVSVGPDPSFETGMGVFVQPTPYIQRVNTVARTGAWSVCMRATGLNANMWSGQYMFYRVSGGQTLAASAWIYTEDDDAPTVHMWGGARRADSTYSNASLGKFWLTPARGQWVRAHAVFTVPEDTHEMRIAPVIEAYNNTSARAGKMVYIDDVNVVDVTDAWRGVTEAKAAAESARRAADDARRVAEALDSGEAMTEIIDSVNGKNTITVSTLEPSGAGASDGDTWWQTDQAGQIYGQWVWAGTVWRPVLIRNEMVASLDVHKLQVTGSAKISDAVIDKVWADGIVAKSMTANRLMVTQGSNLIPQVDNLTQPQTDAEKANSPLRNFGINTKHPSFWLQGRENASIVAPIRLAKGTRYRLSGEAMSSVAGTVFFIQTMHANPDGTSSGTAFTGTRDTATSGGHDAITSYMVGNRTIVSAGNWEPFWSEFTVTQDANITLFFYSNHANGTANPDGYQWWRNLRLEPMTGTTVIEPGAITTEKLGAGAVTADKLTVDQAMINKLAVSSLWAGKINTSMLNVGANYTGGVSISQQGVTIKGAGSGKVQLSTAGLEAYTTSGTRTVAIDTNGNATFTGNITGSTITGSTITGTTITGGTITGATFKTAASGRRLQIDTGGLRFYDSNNNQTAQLDENGLSLTYTTPEGEVQSVGHFFDNSIVGHPEYRGLSIGLDYEQGWYWFFGYRASKTATTYTPALTIDPWGYYNGAAGCTGTKFQLPIC
ncbi:MAG: hypothetical protein MSS97_06235, partial [Arcanobacterium sp.]|nr:hypothetical protein [Arcanobacterium sp.]